MMITIGYEDGTTLRVAAPGLSMESSEYADILDYCLAGALSIEGMCKCNVLVETVNPEWRSRNKYIQIDFEGPTTIATRILTDEEVFRVVHPTRMIFPLSGGSRAGPESIWTTGEGQGSYRVWISGSISSSRLGRMVDELKTGA